MTLSVLVVGSVNFNVITSPSRMPVEHEKLRGEVYVASAGGSAGNTSRALAALGVRTAIVSTVGDDPLGQACLLSMERATVDITLVKTILGHATGLAIVFSRLDS